SLDEARSVLTLTVAVPGGARTVHLGPGASGRGRVEVIGKPPSDRQRAALRGTVRRVLRLDEDLSPFYRAVAADPALAWVASGAGRMIQSPTVFEEVVKTVC